MTAGTLYESVEPHVVWRQLLTAIVADITGDGLELEVRDTVSILTHNVSKTGDNLQRIRLAMFILKTFSSQEEETQTIHLPIVFSAILDVINVRASTFNCFLSHRDALGPATR